MNPYQGFASTRLPLEPAEQIAAVCAVAVLLSPVFACFHLFTDQDSKYFNMLVLSLPHYARVAYRR